MGRPALLGSHPRGPQYRGVQVPPHYRNRPRWRKERTTHLTQYKNPKSIVPALSRSDMTRHDCRYHGRHQRKSNQTIIQDRVAQHNRHFFQTHKLDRTLPGGATWTRLGSAPLVRNMLNKPGRVQRNEIATACSSPQ